MKADWGQMNDAMDRSLDRWATVSTDYTLPLITPQELATMPDAKAHFYAPYIAKGSITEIDGYAKRGKTSFLLYVLGCIVYERPCLGLPTLPTGVLYLTEERYTTFRRALQRCGLLAAPNLHILSRWMLPPALAADWPSVVRLAVQECLAKGCGILVIDTLPQWAGLKGDTENNAGDALAAIEPLQLAAVAGIAPVILRHDRKGGGSVGESGRGSSAFAGAVDTIVAIKKPEGQSAPNRRQLDAISRFDEIPDSLVIERAPEDPFSHTYTGSRFEENHYRSLGAPGELVLEQAERDILDTIKESDGLTAEALKAQHVTVKRPTLTRALDSLRRRGKIDRRGKGKKGDPHVYFYTCSFSSQTSNPIRGDETNPLEAQL